MGTWDFGHLANDDAVELQEEFDTEGARILQEALEAATISVTDYLERPEAQRAIAAAHIIAEARRSGGIEHPGREDLCLPSIAALQRILQDRSELLELWEESAEHGSQWRAGVEQLILDLESR